MGEVMSKVVRLYRYMSLLSGRTVATAEDLMAAPEISCATKKRDIPKLRGKLHLPIDFNREHSDQSEQDHSANDLLGLLFSQEEICSLMTIHHLLEQLEPSILGSKLRSLQKRLSQLMDEHRLVSQDVALRIRIAHAGRRQIVAKSFELVCAKDVAFKNKNEYFLALRDRLIESTCMSYAASY